MKRLAASEGYSLIDLTVGLLLLGIVLLSVYALYRPTFALSRGIGDQLAAQQNIRLAIDRVARAMHETTTAFGRLRVYPAEAGCAGVYEGCIGLVTPRDHACAGGFHLVGGAPDWQATIYVWRDVASKELRLRCDTTTTFPVETWPPPSLEPYTVIGTRVVSASFTLEPSGDTEPTSIALVLEERVSHPPRGRGPVTLVHRTVFEPRN